MAMPLAPDFREFLKLLNSEGVEYLVVGGYAVSHYGYPRPTGDLDIWIAIAPDNARRAKAALVRFGFAESAMASADFTTPRRVFRMGVPPVRIEILTSITGVEFADCFARRNTAILDDVSVPFISREDLLQNKRAAARHKDLNDVERLTE